MAAASGHELAGVRRSGAPEALARLRALLPGLPAGATLEELLPLAPAGEEAALWWRIALASTLLAGLELSRDNAAALEQETAFDAIRMSSCAMPDASAAGSAAAQSRGAGR